MNLLFLIYCLGKCMIIVSIFCRNMTIIFSKSSWFFICSNSFILYWKKTSQEILYTAMLDYLLRYIRSKSGWKLVLDATVVYSHDLNLRINYFSIITFRLYALETSHSRYRIRKVWEARGCKFASKHHFNSDMSMLCIDETLVKVEI